MLARSLETRKGEGDGEVVGRGNGKLLGGLGLVAIADEGWRGDDR